MKATDTFVGKRDKIFCRRLSKYNVAGIDTIISVVRRPSSSG